MGGGGGGSFLFCLRFIEIDHSSFQLKPTKNEVLLDFAFLTRITGE